MHVATLSTLASHAEATLRGVLERRRRYGRVYHERCARLQRDERLPLEVLERAQLAELRRVVSLAATHSPYYHAQSGSLRALSDSLRSMDDLRRIPVTTRETLRARSREFVVDHLSHASLLRWHTSGTTGSPVTLYWTREALQTLLAFVAVHRRVAGVDVLRDRRAQFTGGAIVPPGRRGATPRVFWRHDLANRTLQFSTAWLHGDNLAAYARALARFRPDYLAGYPSAAYLLAQHYLAEGAAPALRMKGVFTHAETLLEHQREAIERAFGTRVYDQYGQTEVQSFWFECERGRMHAHPLAGVTEVLAADGSPARPGEVGDVVLTGFINDAMPLLRYAIGDRAALSDARCECGRAMPVIARIEGRVDDFVYTEERGYVGRLDGAFKGLRGFVECQVVQESIDRVRVLYVPAPGMRPDDLEQLVANLRARLGDRVALELSAVERVPRGANGKFRAVVSKLPEAMRRGALDAVPRGGGGP